MESKTKLQKIGEILGFSKSEEIVKDEVVTETVENSEEIKLVSAVLEDGTSVEIEPAIEVGAAVVVIDGDGNPVPAPDGVHVLADGTQVATVEGIITEIAEPEMEEEEMANDETSKESEAERVAKKVVESTIKESHFVSEEKVNEIVEAVKEEFNKALETAKEELVTKMFSAFEEFGKKESKEPIKKTEYTFNKSTKGKRNIFHS